MQGILGADDTPTGDAADLATLLAEPRRLVSPRARYWWFVRSLLGSLFLCAVFAVWVYFDEGRRTVQWWVGGFLVLDVIATAFAEPIWRYRVHRWDVTDIAVFTRSGWFSQQRRVAPISRVQTVDVDRGPLARLFGLATVQVTTASADGPVEIEGLDLATAEELSAHLTAITAATPGDAT